MKTGGPLNVESKLNRFPFLDTESLHRAAIICHRNADADSYLSAFALSKLLKSLAPGCGVDVITPGGVTRLTEKLVAMFPRPAPSDEQKEYDLYVAVDVGDEALLNEWKDKMTKSGGVKVLVDHHPLRESETYDRVVVDEDATSAAEVVFRLFCEADVDLDKKTAQALLEGILFDSSHLAIASPTGVRAVVRLMDLGGDLALARRELRSEPDYGEVLAKLKGAQRIKIYRVGEWVAATSLVGSFQAHVARSLIYLGADVAVVAGESEGETRVSLRSTQRLAEATGVKLGVQVAGEMSKRLGGHGGGHATAASFATGKGEDEALEGTLRRVGELLGEIRPID